VVGFLARRTVASIPVVFGIVFVVFAITRLLPGDPCRAALGERATVALCRDYVHRNGLDQPVIVQFAIYLQHLSRLDFGTSSQFGVPVTDLLLERLPVTLELSFYAIAFAIAAGIPLGVLAAYKHNSLVDTVTMVLANLGISIPVFVLGLALAVLFAIALKNTPLALPPSGRLSSAVSLPPLAETWGLQSLGGLPRGLLDFLSNIYTLNALITLNGSALSDAVRHLVLPAFTLGTIPLAIIARMTRSSVIEVLGLDYIRAARAKGLTEFAVVGRHALANAMLPVVTVIGLQLGSLFGGAILTETVFNLSGVGLTLYQAITGRDYVVVQTFTLVVAIGFVLVNLAVDVSYAYLDPRVRLS
jgi:peptide/nickel transport system permease protein